MRVPMLSSILSALALAAWAMPASAQWVVFDPTNFSQAVLTAARELQQVENQVQELANEAQMLVNESKNLQSLPMSRLSQLQASISTTQRLLDQSQGLAFQLAAIQQQFSQLYPSGYSASNTRSQINADALARWSNSREALSTALQLEAQASQNVPSDQAVLTDLVSASQSAVGALQAVQATNQLLALQARQTIQGQQLAIADGRATAVERARALEADARTRELRQRFMSQSTTYTPQPLQGF